MSSAPAAGAKPPVERYCRLFATMAQGVVFQDADGRIVDANPAAERILGVSLDAMRGRTLLDPSWQAIHEDGSPFAGEDHPAMLSLRSGRPASAAMGVFHPAQGEHRWIRIDATPEFGGGGPTPSGVFTTFVDVTEAKRTERVLRESEEKHRLLAENAADIIWTRDLDLRLTYVSRSVTRVRGFTVEEAMTQTVDQWPPATVALIAEVFAEEMALEGAPGVDPNRVRTLALQDFCKDGSIIWTENNLSFLRDDAGRPIGVLGVTRDITKRKRLEESLRESARQMHDIIEFLPDAAFVVDTAGVVIAWNRAAEDLTGVAKDRIIGHGGFEHGRAFWGEPTPILVDLLLSPNAALEGRYAGFSRAGDHAWAEAYVPNLRGHRAFVSVTASILRDSQGAVVGAIECVRDFTARRQAEEALRESERRLADIIQFLPDATFVVDESGKVIAWNRAIEEMTGVAAAAMIGRGDYEYALPFYGARRPILIDLAKSIHFSPEGVYHNVARQGDIIFAEAHTPALRGVGAYLSGAASVLRDAEGRIVGAIECIRDRTAEHRAAEERDKLAEQLRQAQKMEAVGRLAGGVAHDFNNILTGIIVSADLLLAATPADGQRGQDIAEIKKSAQRAAALTAQLLAFSRKQIISPRVLDVNELLAESTRMLRRLVGEDVDFRFVPTARPCRVKVDPVQLEQVLINLVVNARDAMPQGGTLVVETGRETIDGGPSHVASFAPPGEYVFIAVRDTGVGIEPDLLEHIFEPFYTTKGTGKGTGLGLSTVYGVATQNRGFVTVDSAPGKGTTFVVYLPLASQAPADAPARRPPLAARGQETVLLVEDEDIVRNLARRILERQGYEVLAAEDGEAALRLCATAGERIALMITDVIMPRMNGQQLAERIGAVAPRAKVLYMSGYTQDAIAHRGELQTGAHFIQKPFDVDALVRKVRDVLGADESA